MRLYSLVGAVAHDDPVYGHFEPDPQDDSFPFPDEVSDVIGRSAVKGRRMWETEEERAERMHGMEMARRRDPASMLSAMEENQALVRKLTELTAQLAAAQLGQMSPAQALAAPEGEPVPVTAEAPAKTARTSKATPLKGAAGPAT